MPDQITVRRCATQDEAEVFNRILSWNDIASKVVADSKTREFHVQVNTEKEQAADAVLKLTDNRPPSNPDKFAFVSHTAIDAPFIEKHVAPIFRKRYMDLLFLNYFHFTKIYAQYILRGLENSGWFVVVLSISSIHSQWVRFELNWALEHKERRRIIPLVIDDVDPTTLDRRLSSFDIVDFRKPSKRVEQQLLAIFPEVNPFL
jgi:TIR domain